MPHFYDKDGNPHFDLTPRKAKEMGYFYSVTEIQRIEASPGLDIWKQNTLLENAYTHPPEEDEELKPFQVRIKNALYGDKSATALGTKIHDGIEQVLGGVKALKHLDSDLVPFVQPAIEYFQEKGFEAEHLERIVVHEDEAYAGTADVIGKTPGGQDFILDWKSTKKCPSKPYPQQPEQISAYAVAHFGLDRVMNGEIWGANVYISTTETDKKTGMAKIKACSYNPEQVAEHYKVFCLVNNLFRCRTKYDPRP